MATCVPISELKDSAAFSKKVAQAGEPVIVTKNGYEQFVVIDANLFREFRRETPAEHLERLLQEADRDIRAGRISDMSAGIEAIRAKYGL
ncbi:type II toxin-antitoxin system prevent-host-death family antitoxin [[Collinsella] massiliensis]|uniref:Antitoxin n=1 Tax=[Collinsella] massiliensis TaxID=1232426 RepID=A0A1Y3XZQ9_9ACTN|nr:type II toxin-antitoxin system prevent-host-death family antitoxin [[Collinsella] massiliensis]OUN88727.1 prevent-host-death family protein [[Collinsella] massiliensis]